MNRFHGARSLGVVILLVALASVCISSAIGAQPSEGAKQLAQRYFQAPRLSRIAISPAGTHYAALYSEGGRESIVVREIGTPNAVPLVSLPDPQARFRWLTWANDERILFSVEELAPSPTPPKSIRTRLYGVNKDGSKYFHMARNWGKSLMSRGEAQFQLEDQIIDMLEDDPKHALIAIRLPTEYYPAAYRLNVATGGIKRVVSREEGVLTWHADHDGAIRVGTGYAYGTFRMMARKSVDDDFEEIARFGSEEGEELFFEDFGFDPKILYVSRFHEGFRVLSTYDLESEEVSEPLMAKQGYDVPQSLEFSDERRTLVAALYNGERRSRHFFDETERSRMAALDKALPGTFKRILSETRDGSKAIVLAEGSTKAPTYYLYEPAKKNLALLFSTLPGISHLRGAPTRAVSYEARDGRTIPAYLTLPPGRDKQLPLVLMPHGGPSARDVWGWDPAVQYLAQMGFAVLQPNFRGSTGYGSDHQLAGLQEWGGTMQDDLTDGLDWLVAEGTVDPDRVCAFGSSYGGYASLMALVKTPQKFRCAASYAGPTDLVMMLNHDKGYAFSEVNVPAVGSTIRDRERLRQTSPLNQIAKIRAPVLLAHGEDDERVHVAHALKLAEALGRAGKPVELLVIEDEAHAFRAERGRIEFFTALGEFLLKHTRPRAAPSQGAD